jgi:hypothetical protein
MKRIILSFVAIFATIFAFAQTSITVNVKNVDGESVSNIEVSVSSKSFNKSTPSNQSGVATFSGLKTGTYTIKVKQSINYNANLSTLTLGDGETQKSVDIILIRKSGYELQEVSVIDNKNKSVTINKTDAAVAQYI